MSLRADLGLDEPLMTQYVGYMVGIAQGDFGVSVRSGEIVTEMIKERFPASATLAITAIVMVIATGIPLGVAAAVKRGTAIDTIARGIALFGMAIPSFLGAILAIQIFSVHLGLLPSSGTGGWRHHLLPALTLGSFLLAGVVRLVRTSMLEVLESEFVKFARAKGRSETKVIWKHALRNALIPVLSFTGLYFAMLFTAAIAVEIVFAWPGLGRMTYEAILYRDFPVMQGVILAAGVIVIVVSLIVDMLYAAIDPRIRVPAS